MKYTEPTFRKLVDEMLTKTIGFDSTDLPDFSLWEYFDLDYDYTPQEIAEAAQIASIDLLVEADGPSDLLIEIVQDLIKQEANTLRGI
jgi:hypothetical protein